MSYTTSLVSIALHLAFSEPDTLDRTILPSEIPQTH
jgi:hypothetical protein